MCWCNCGSNILINIIHPVYRFAFLLCVYANMLIFVLPLPPSLQMICLSLILCLSSSQLSPPISLSHIKTHGNLFLVIIDCNKVVRQTLLLHLRAEYNTCNWFCGTSGSCILKKKNFSSLKNRQIELIFCFSESAPNNNLTFFVENCPKKIKKKKIHN